jgi:small conductance mechanosensitive channel
VPNGTISSTTITNCSTEGKRRVDIKITASYDAPIPTVKKALMEAIAATDNTLDEPMPPFVRVFSYGESSIEYIIRVWSLNADYWNVYFDLMENIKVYFDKNDVEMTYNHLNVHMMKD